MLSRWYSGKNISTAKINKKIDKVIEFPDFFGKHPFFLGFSCKNKANSRKKKKTGEKYSGRLPDNGSERKRRDGGERKEKESKRKQGKKKRKQERRALLVRAAGVASVVFFFQCSTS